MKKFATGCIAGVVLIGLAYIVGKVTDDKYGWTDRILSWGTSESSSIPSLSPEEYMSEVKVQVSGETDGKRSLRFVAAVKGDYNEETGESTVPGKYGFKTLINGTEKETEVTKYYNSITAGGVTFVNPYSEIESESTIDDFAGKTGYTFFVTLTIENIPSSSYDSEISVTPYLDLDGGRIMGETKTTSVNDLILTI